MNYNRELNKGMKVFSQLYVGLKAQGEGKVDLGFATPHEDNAAGKKRQVTVHKWCATQTAYVIDENTGLYVTDDKGHLIPNKITPRSLLIDNKPRGGFKITDDIKRLYWGGGNVVWRVEDPAGFELEIQSQNLMAIIQTAGVNEGGLIPGYCLWGRDGSNNILLHEKSEEYENAILAAETLKKPKEVGSAERKLGTTYLMQDAREGTYLGKFWVCADVEEAYPGIFRVQTSSISGIARGRRRKIGSPVQFDAVLFGKLDGSNGSYVKLYKKAPLVREVGQALNGILDCVAAGEAIRNATSLSFASSSIKSRIAYIHYEKPQKLQFVMRKLRQDRFEKKLDKLKNKSDCYFNHGETRSVGDFYAFYGGYGVDAAITGIKTPEGLFANFVSISNHYTKPGTQHKMMFNMTINGDTLDEFWANQYEVTGDYVNHYGELATSPQMKIHELPSFGTSAAIAEWYQQQFDAGNLIEIVAEAI